MVSNEPKKGGNNYLTWKNSKLGNNLNNNDVHNKSNSKLKNTKINNKSIINY